MNNEFYADVKVVDEERFNSIFAKYNGYGAEYDFSRMYYNLHFINGQTDNSVIKFYTYSNNHRRVYCCYNGYIISYKIINISRKDTYSPPTSLHTSIMNYRQNLKEIEKLRAANRRIANEHLKRGS